MKTYLYTTKIPYNMGIESSIIEAPVKVEEKTDWDTFVLDSMEEFKGYSMSDAMEWTAKFLSKSHLKTKYTRKQVERMFLEKYDKVYDMDPQAAEQHIKSMKSITSDKDMVISYYSNHIHQLLIMLIKETVVSSCIDSKFSKSDPKFCENELFYGTYFNKFIERLTVALSDAAPAAFIAFVKLSYEKYSSYVFQIIDNHFPHFENKNVARINCELYTITEGDEINEIFRRVFKVTIHPILFCSLSISHKGVYDCRNIVWEDTDYSSEFSDKLFYPIIAAPHIFLDTYNNGFKLTYYNIHRSSLTWKMFRCDIYERCEKKEADEKIRDEIKKKRELVYSKFMSLAKSNCYIINLHSKYTEDNLHEAIYNRAVKYRTII